MHTRKRHSKHNSKLSYKQKKTTDPKARTFESLSSWYIYIFQNFGWMVLEKERGNHLNMQSYKDSTNRLLQSLKFKLNNIHEYDRKEDILIMINNIQTLQKFIDKEM
jgi:hypothetical protein